MSNQADKINIEDYKKLIDQKVTLGAKVQEFIKSEGFLILKAIFYNFEQDTKEKENYTSLEDFKADRKALNIVKGLLGELDSMINDADQAQHQITQLIESESSTPSILSLEGEGIDDGQLTEL